MSPSAGSAAAAAAAAAAANAKLRADAAAKEAAAATTASVQQQTTERAAWAAFGARVKSYRSSKGLSLRKLAQAIGVSPTYLSGVERGEFPPPVEKRVLDLAKVLDLDADELLAQAGHVPPDLQEIIRKRPAAMSRLLRAAGRLDDPALKRLVQSVERKAR